MNLWVTGGNGFIGRSLIQLLANRGHCVLGLGHGAIDEAERSRLNLTEWINGEIDAPNLSALADHHGLPSAIFHLGGGSSVGQSIEQPYEDFNRTVNSTARLLEWLRRSAPDCRLIVSSSAAVYGSCHSGPISEQVEPRPVSPYGHHKLLMEQLCRSYAASFGLRIMVVRLFSVYGSTLRKQLLWEMCSRLRRGERKLVLGGTGAEIRDWVDVRDVAELFAAVAEQQQQQEFEALNGGCGTGTTVAEIAAILTKSWGDHIDVSFSGVARRGDPFSLVADNTKLQAFPFTWRVPLALGIAEYVGWFKDQAH